MKKLIVALLIIGTFLLYSFLYHSNAVVLVPGSSTTSSSSASTPPGTSTPSAPSSTGSSGPGTGAYKDGSYTGSVADATWGNVQVKAVVQNGKITSATFLQYPNDRSRSISINNYADPILSNEAIQAQSAQVDIVTGATDTSNAFIQSLTDALTQAKA